jgi:hypothetical protein
VLSSIISDLPLNKKSAVSL